MFRKTLLQTRKSATKTYSKCTQKLFHNGLRQVTSSQDGIISNCTMVVQTIKLIPARLQALQGSNQHLSLCRCQEASHQASLFRYRFSQGHPKTRIAQLGLQKKPQDPTIASLPGVRTLIQEKHFSTFFFFFLTQLESCTNFFPAFSYSLWFLLTR